MPEYGSIPVTAGINENDIVDGLYSYYEYVDGRKYYGFMNISGKIIIEPYFSEVGVFSEDGRCPVCLDRKWGIIDKFGKLVVSFEFDEIRNNPSEGFWTCYLHDRGYGFLNLDTGSSIACQYSSCGIFSDGVVPVQKDGYWGAIDIEGNTAVEFLYDEMLHWQIPFSYEEHELAFVNGLIPVMVNGAKGVIDSAGNYMLPMDKVLTGDVEKYDKISFLDSNDSAVIVFDGVFYGLNTKDGLVGSGIAYNKISYDDGSRICIMELGATTEKYRLGPDGTANALK